MPFEIHSDNSLYSLSNITNTSTSSTSLTSVPKSVSTSSESRLPTVHQSVKERKQPPDNVDHEELLEAVSRLQR